MFDWYKKKRLNEQIEFFGGEKQKFISCYSKQAKLKPHIRIKNKDLITIDLYPRYAAVSLQQSLCQQGLANAAMQSQYGSNLANLQQQAMGGMGGMGAANQGFGALGNLAGLGIGARGY